MNTATLTIGTTVALSAAGRQGCLQLGAPEQRQKWRGVIVGIVFHSSGWTGYTVESGTVEVYLNDYEVTTTQQEQA
jgi:hypothetical protein